MKRYHDLDALRAIAMSLGIALHAFVLQVPDPFWPVQGEFVRTLPIEKNPYAYAVAFIHGFRMPLFFLLSGFFAAMMLQRRGMKGLLLHRLKRIGLPLLVGTVTIVPCTIWLFVPGGFELWAWPIVWIYAGFAHLWFLWYLLLIAIGYGLVAALGIRFSHGVFWLLLPCVLGPQLFMGNDSFGADPPADGVLPEAKLLAYYVVFFLCGVFVYQRSIAIRHWWSVFLPMAIVIFPVALVLMAIPANLLGVSPELKHLTVKVLQVAFAWLMCFGLMGLFRWIASGERFWIRYMSDASYWMYLAHLPLIVFAQMLTLDWTVNAHLMMFVICAGALAVLLLSYETCVRYTLVGTMLNGPRVRRKVTA